MILSDTAIEAAVERGEIVIDPYDRANLGGNSYDVHLSRHLKTYRVTQDPRAFGLGMAMPMPLDAAVDNQTDDIDIPDAGLVLEPGTLYLGSTVEYTETHAHVPYLDGRSSAGRLGISIHATAGRGDVGFCNHWTLEITVVHPTRLYAGVRIGQLTFHEVAGAVVRQYASKGNVSYAAVRDPRPVSSGLWRSVKRGKS